MDDSNSNLQMKQQQQQRTGMKAKTRSSSGKSKKKPIKVVYISNPKKVTTSASEFRALVQQLTGQDADDLPDRNDFITQNSSSRRHPESSSTQHYDVHDQHLFDDVDGLLLRGGSSRGAGGCLATPNAGGASRRIGEELVKIDNLVKN